MPGTPIIGITYSSFELEGFLLWRRMFQGVVAAGATPLAIDCALPQPTVAGLVARLDGLLIGGGGDVSPHLYGGDTADPAIRGVNHDRDAAELAALAAARAAGLPILAICRGAQLVNVALGGTLIADIQRDLPTAVVHRRSEEALARPLHPVTVAPGTLLASWLGRAGRIAVNSQHHQGIGVLAEGLTAAARSDDSLVEGIELGDERLVGVQWHPEVLWPTEEHARRLLASFAGECLRTGPRPSTR